MFDFRRFYTALSTVLGEEINEELSAWLSDCDFGRKTYGSLRSRFEEWMLVRYRQSGDLRFVVECLGTKNTKRLLTELGCAYPPTISTATLSKALTEGAGLPTLSVFGRSWYATQFQQLMRDVSVDAPDEARIATDARRHAERLLRETAALYIHTDAAPLLVSALTKDDKIGLPRQILDRTSLGATDLKRHLLDESVGDLGFLAFLLRRGGTCATKATVVSLDADILTQDEFNAFDALAKALQPYVHFKPSRDLQRLTSLRAAISACEKATDHMAQRRSLPDATILLERVTGFLVD